MATVYAKLENGVMTYAPETIFVDGVKVTNPTHEMLVEAGYLPVKPTDAPNVSTSFIAVPSWEKTENESALPHPNSDFSVNGTKYEIGDEDWQAYTVEYKLAYSDYLLKNSAKWNILSNDEQVELLKKAHQKGHEAAKKWYMAKYGIKEKR